MSPPVRHASPAPTGSARELGGLRLSARHMVSTQTGAGTLRQREETQRLRVGLVSTDPSRWDKRRKADVGGRRLDVALRQDVKVCAFRGSSQRGTVECRGKPGLKYARRERSSMLCKEGNPSIHSVRQLRKESESSERLAYGRWPLSLWGCRVPRKRSCTKAVSLNSFPGRWDRKHNSSWLRTN